MGGKKRRNTSTLRLISGIANLKTQGILQIDWKESRSVYSQQSRDEMFILVMWTVGQGSQSKMGLLVSAFECLGATVSLFYSLKKKTIWSKKAMITNDVKTFKLRFTSFLTCQLSMHPVWWWSLYFLLFDITCHDIWYDMIWRKCSTIIVFSSIIVVDGDVVEYCKGIGASSI